VPPVGVADKPPLFKPHVVGVVVADAVMGLLVFKVTDAVAEQPAVVSVTVTV
jgi:hypothetical protein